MPGIAGEPGVSVTSPLSDSFDCQTTSQSARWLWPRAGVGRLRARADWRGVHVGDSGGLTVQTQVTAHSWHRNKNPAGMLEIVLLVVCLIKFYWLVMSSIYLYSPVSQITSLPQEGLQSAEHTAPSILRHLIQIRKSSRLSSSNTTHTEMKIFKLRWCIFTFHLFFKKNLFIKGF